MRHRCKFYLTSFEDAHSLKVNTRQVFNELLKKNKETSLPPHVVSVLFAVLFLISSPYFQVRQKRLGPRSISYSQFSLSSVLTRLVGGDPLAAWVQPWLFRCDSASSDLCDPLTFRV